MNGRNKSITQSQVLSVRVDLFVGRRSEFLAGLIQYARGEGVLPPVISVLEESVYGTTLVISEPH